MHFLLFNLANFEPQIILKCFIDFGSKLFSLLFNVTSTTPQSTLKTRLNFAVTSILFPYQKQFLYHTPLPTGSFWKNIIKMDVWGNFNVKIISLFFHWREFRNVRLKAVKSRILHEKSWFCLLQNESWKAFFVNVTSLIAPRPLISTGNVCFIFQLNQHFDILTM